MQYDKYNKRKFSVNRVYNSVKRQAPAEVQFELKSQR